MRRLHPPMRASRKAVPPVGFMAVRIRGITVSEATWKPSFWRTMPVTAAFIQERVGPDINDISRWLAIKFKSQLYFYAKKINQIISNKNIFLNFKFLQSPCPINLSQKLVLKLFFYYFNDIESKFRMKNLSKDIALYLNNISDNYYSLLMPKLFEGSQFIRILIKDKNGFSLTKKLPCEDYYEDTANNLFNKHHLKPINLKVLSYQMVRKPSRNYLKVVAIFYAECEDRLPEHLLSKKQDKLNHFKSLIKQELPSAKIFDAEGNPISLLKIK